MIFLLVLFLLESSIGLAQSGGNFDITRLTTDAGGDVSSGGGFGLTGTIGQPLASPPATGSSFTLSGGFWPANGKTPVIREETIFADGFETVAP